MNIIVKIAIVIILCMLVWLAGLINPVTPPEEPERQFGANTDYYVSNFGSDGNNGLASSTAWKSLDKVVANGLAEGDTVYLRCGDIFREQFSLPNSGVSGNPITITKYGNCTYPDNLPIIAGSYDYGSSTDDWIDTGANIWATATGTFANIGHIFEWDGVATNTINALPQEAANEAALDTQGEFWNDHTNDLVKMYSTQNPATEYTMLEITTSAIWGNVKGNSKDYIDFDGVAVMFSYIHAFDLGGAISYWNIKNGWAAWCGSEPAAGNCVQVTGSSNNLTVDNMSIWAAFDSGVSPQNFNQGDAISNITYTNNDIYDTPCPVEFLTYTPEGGDHDAVSISNVTVENNTLDCARNGNPWALEFNQVGDNGIQSLVWPRGTTTNIRIIGNTIRNCTGKAGDTSNGNGIRILTNVDNDYPTDHTNWTIEGNKIYDNQYSAISFEMGGGSSKVNTSSALVINNIMYNNGIEEIETVGDFEGLRFHNNTIVDTTGDTTELIDGNSGTTKYMYNNILQGNKSTNATSGSTFIASNNLYYSTSGVANFAKAELNAVNDWPQFDNATISAGVLDFDISSGSPAEDAGLDSAHPTSTDYYGNSKVGSAWDIGAMEIQAAAAATVQTIKRIFDGGFKVFGGLKIF